MGKNTNKSIDKFQKDNSRSKLNDEDMKSLIGGKKSSFFSRFCGGITPQ